MKVIYEGKTKRIVSVGDRMVLQFKDDVTGNADGNVNSRGDFIVGHMEGKGEASANVAA